MLAKKWLLSLVLACTFIFLNLHILCTIAKMWYTKIKVNFHKHSRIFTLEHLRKILEQIQ